MMVKCRIIVFHLLLSGISTSTISQGIDIEYQLFDNGSVEIEWKIKPKISVREINLYVYEGVINSFPRSHVETINSRATAWKSVPRNTDTLMGLEIRDPFQIINRKVFTRGEVYTIGIIFDIVDSRTAKTIPYYKTIIIPPFKRISRTILFDDTKKIKNDQLWSELSFDIRNNFIKIKGSEFFLEWGGPLMRIKAVSSNLNSFYLTLENNELVQIFKEPNRPKTIGRRKFLIYTFSFFLLTFAFVIVFIIYIFIKTLKYINYLEEDSNDIKEIFKAIISSERFSIFILYFVTRYYKKKINLKSHTLAITIDHEFKKVSISNTTVITNRILEIIESSDLNSSPTVFISYSRTDQTIAVKISQLLEKENFKVLMDINALVPGQNIKDFIETSIRQSNATILIVSNRSLLSTWVCMETMEAFQNGKFFNKKFIGCYIEDDFFKKSFTIESIEKINSEITEINNLLIKYSQQNIDSADLNDEKARLFKLRNNLSEIVNRLRNSLCLDFRPNSIEENLKKLSDSLKL